MPIYTKKGDQGQTSLINKERVWKNSKRVNAYGAVDELNSVLGVTSALFTKPKSKRFKYLADLTNLIQNDLFYFGSCLANPGSQVTDIDIEDRVKTFEKEIDKMTEKLPELHNFILPGGGEIGAFLHLVRTACRRAERRIVNLLQSGEEVDGKIIIYLNRLSDLLFTMARFANFIEHKKENIWLPKNLSKTG